MRVKAQIGRIAALLSLCAIAGTAALAQTRAGGSFTLHWAPYSPIIALIAGILILIFPRILNYVVAIYLILIGIIGLLGR